MATQKCSGWVCLKCRSWLAREHAVSSLDPWFEFLKLHVCDGEAREWRPADVKPKPKRGYIARPVITSPALPRRIPHQGPRTESDGIGRKPGGPKKMSTSQ